MCNLVLFGKLFFEFELDHSTTEAIKNIFCAKGGGAVVYSTVTRRFKKFCSGCKNLEDQVRSSGPKTADSIAVLQWVALGEY